MNNFINKNIPIYLISELQKFDFGESDFKKISKLHLSSFDLGNNFLSNSLKDLNTFPNLTKLWLSKYIINKDNINILENSKINDYTFYNCDFKDKIDISGENLKVISCKNIFNIDFSKFQNVIIQNSDISNLKFDNIINKNY